MRLVCACGINYGTVANNIDRFGNMREVQDQIINWLVTWFVFVLYGIHQQAYPLHRLERICQY
jgi:hypothetical protein